MKARLLTSLAAFALLATGAAAQSPVYKITPELEAAARKEGNVVYYTSIDVKVAENLAKASLAALKASGAGAIVNIGGLTAHTGAVDRVHVVTAKAGLVGFTRALAHDLAPHGITVNNVAPGMMDTVRGASAGHQQPKHHATHQTLLGRRGHPDEIGSTVRWLAGPGGRFVTGQVIHLNGGTYLGG